jgi:hypothetical protein
MAQALLNLSDQLLEDTLPTEHFKSILSDIPHARIQFEEWGPYGLRTLQLVAIPGLIQRVQRGEVLDSIFGTEMLRLE